MSDTREISKKRIKTLEELGGKPVNTDDLKHMKENDNLFNIKRASNWIEAGVALFITKDPRRQRKDENEQLVNLLRIFPNIARPEQKTYLNNGLFLTDASNISEGSPPDLDAILVEKENEWKIGFTLKGGQKEDGGAQNHQFDDVIKTIEQAPNSNSNTKNILIVYVSGLFWTKNRRTYKIWKPSKPPFNLIDCLKQKAQGKKCIIWSDDDLPKQPVSFYDTYIKGTYEE